MNNTDYDISIMGGGLAGLSLAIIASKAGYSVALYEKENYPHHKVCGEYISNESYSFIKGLGLPLENWTLPFINQLELSDAKGKQYDFSLDLGGFGISRYKLDHALYEIAKANGVDVFSGIKVNDIHFENNTHFVNAGAASVSSKVSVAAYGKRSNVDVKWNRKFTSDKPNKLNNYIAVKYHIHYPWQENKIALHNFKNGYCGISRIEDGKSCLCYLTVAENLSASGNSIKAMEEKILFKNPQLKKIFTGAEFLYEQPLTISQISFSKKQQVENHTLMTGDSAGLITPLCGNGMSMALHSSKIAFESICLYLEKKISREAMEANYTNQWNNAFASRLFTGRLVQTFTGNNFTTSAFLFLLEKIPWLSKKIIKSTHGSKF